MHDPAVANGEDGQGAGGEGLPEFVFRENAGHTDGTVKRQTLPEALEYLWQGYPK